MSDPNEPQPGLEPDKTDDIDARLNAALEAKLGPLQDKIQTLTDQNTALRERLESRQAQPVEDDPRLPKTEREWTFAEALARRNAELDPELQPQLNMFLQARDDWRRRHETVERDRSRGRERFEDRLEALQVAKGSKQYKIAMAAFKEGVPPEEIEQEYLNAVRKATVASAEHDIHRQRAARESAATAVEEPGESSPPLPSRKSTAEEVSAGVNKALIEAMKRRGATLSHFPSP